MKVVEKAVESPNEVDAMQFDASVPVKARAEKWPKGVIERPGSGWFFVIPGPEFKEVGISDGDWVVGTEVVSDADYKKRFEPSEGEKKAIADSKAAEKAAVARTKKAEAKAKEDQAKAEDVE